MPTLASLLPTVFAAFLAAGVEAVEALTIVLAVGLTRGWRPALGGTVLALLVLAVIVGVLGPLLEFVPLALLQFLIGTLLVLFGLRWLRKGVLRAAGHLPQHDETLIFAKETRELSRHAHGGSAGAAALLTAFNGVLLEGLEIVFIVLAVGAGRGLTLYASAGAVAAVVLVALAGLAVHRPLARIPENVLKLVVGVMLTSFGVFWVGEGLGVDWPEGELSLLGVVVIFAAVVIGSILWLRPTRQAQLRVVK